MKIQSLISTMHQNDLSIYDRMNIQTDALVINQCNEHRKESIQIGDTTFQMYSFSERGVGLSRNNALMRSDADICLMADDDMVFLDGYERTVLDVFGIHAKADVIIFNLIEDPVVRYVTKRPMVVNQLNFMRFGAARLAFRRKKILKHGITFNLLFGGGTSFSAGEDTLFLKQCLDAGLKIIAVPEAIASLETTRESTWFKGYNEKYFCDKGVLFDAVSKSWSWLLCLQFLMRHRRLTKDYPNVWIPYKYMIQGIKEFRKI